MPTETDEERVAEAIEEVMRITYGRQLGARRRRDEPSEKGIKVDFTYEETDPPLALEVTSLNLDDHLADAAEAARLAEELSGVADRERLGSWQIDLDHGTPLKEAKRELLQLMRGGQAFRADNCTSKDLAYMERPAAFVAMHRRLRSLGIRRCEPASRKTNGLVSIALMSGVTAIGSFAGPLAHAIEDCRKKLGDARELVSGDPETHLAVEVRRFDASRWPGRTEVPDLPDEVDVLWVIFRWHEGLGLPSIWELRRGASGWIYHDLHDTPPGQIHRQWRHPDV